MNFINYLDCLCKYKTTRLRRPSAPQPSIYSTLSWSVRGQGPASGTDPWPSPLTDAVRARSDSLTDQSDGTSQNLLRLVTHHQVSLPNAVQDPVVLLESLISDQVVSC